jgi:Tol biopolymer transport system component
MRADGSQHRKLETGTEAAAAPAFSSNGKALAFSGPDHLYVLDLQTGTSRPVTTGPGDHPAWSPDGKLLAFTRGVDIHVVGADGAGERRVVTGPPPGQAWYSNYGHPVFTRDGQSILFDRQGAVEICDLDGGNRRVLFASGQYDYPMVAISPDGDDLAFGAMCGFAMSEIRIVPLSRANEDPCKMGRRLPKAFNNQRPAWGTNGLLAYAETAGSLDLWTVPAAGGAPTNLMTDALKEELGGRYINEPAWSPPGTVLP